MRDIYLKEVWRQMSSGTTTTTQSIMPNPRKQSGTLLSPSAPAPAPHRRTENERKPPRTAGQRGRTCSDVSGLELLAADGGAAGRRHRGYLFI